MLIAHAVSVHFTNWGIEPVSMLDMSVREAMEHFSVHKEIIRILKTLDDVGLGYITLGQSATTLSGSGMSVWSSRASRARSRAALR